MCASDMYTISNRMLYPSYRIYSFSDVFRETAGNFLPANIFSYNCTALSARLNCVPLPSISPISPVLIPSRMIINHIDFD